MLFSFSSGLTLDLFVNQDEYIPSLSQEAGVRVLLTDERSIPFPVDEGFTVSPGFATSIGLRKVCLVNIFCAQFISVTVLKKPKQEIKYGRQLRT